MVLFYKGSKILKLSGKNRKIKKLIQNTFFFKPQFSEKKKKMEFQIFGLLIYRTIADTF